MANSELQIKDSNLTLLATNSVNLEHIIGQIATTTREGLYRILTILQQSTDKNGSATLPSEQVELINALITTHMQALITRTKQALAIAKLPPDEVYGVTLNLLTQEEVDQMLPGTIYETLNRPLVKG